MGIRRSYFSKVFLGIMAILGWFALITQFIINVRSNVAGTSEIVIRYFSYFTILTNLLVAICCTIILWKPSSKSGDFFSGQKTLTAITVYILVVGLIYNVILRFIWNPQGLQKIVDELLHSIIPVLFLLLWIFFVRKKKLKWKVLLPWLIYPFTYLVFILIRGAFSGFYPYPFLDVIKLGFGKVFLNSLGVTLIFIALSGLFILIGNFTKARRADN